MYNIFLSMFKRTFVLNVDVIQIICFETKKNTMKLSKKWIWRKNAIRVLF